MMRAPASGLLRRVLPPERHQARHLLLGETDFLAAEFGERQIPDLVRLAAGGSRGVERMELLSDSSHVKYSPVALAFCSLASDFHVLAAWPQALCLTPALKARVQAARQARATKSAGPLARRSGGSGTMRGSPSPASPSSRARSSGANPSHAWPISCR